MESIIKKLFLIGTATLAIAVTLTSVSTQAFTCTAADKAAGKCTDDLPQNSTGPFGAESTFSFTVAANTLDLKGVAGAQVTIKNFELNKGELRVGVVSNQPFQILLADAVSGNGGKLVGATGSMSITPSTNLSSGNVWGIQKYDRDNPSSSGYLALSNTSKTVYKSGTGSNFVPAFSDGALTDFVTPESSTGSTGVTEVGGDYSALNYVPIPFGVHVDTSLTPTTYSTTVKVTVTDGMTDDTAS